LTLGEDTERGIKVLSKTMDSTTLSPEKAEFATLSRVDDASGTVQFKLYEDSELKPILEAVNAEQTKEREQGGTS